MSASAEVRLNQVSKRYGSTVAVKPLDLVIPAGSLVTLLGPSGCGKTTLLRMIAGLERASGGTIMIGGTDVTQLSAGERNVSMVFQSYALFPHMTVIENVAYGLVSGGMAKREAHTKAEGALATVGLKGFGPRLPSQMSGGQQQRVAVARALVLEPQVLLFDEPLSNLDARLRRSMREEIRALQQSLGVTVVYVTHDQSEALAVSDLIVVMRAAEIAQVGTPRQLYEEPDNVFVATFMGEANHVRGTLEASSASQGIVTLGGLQMQLGHRNLPSGAVDVVIRPEAIRLVDPSTAGCLAATVRTATYMGAHAEYNLVTSAGSLFAIAPEAMALRPADSNVGVLLADRGVFAVRA
jgi:iron(III) transport system ATP-binding protein